MRHRATSDCLGSGRAGTGQKPSRLQRFNAWVFLSAFLLLAACSAGLGQGQEPRDPVKDLLELLVRKGMLTKDEASIVRLEDDYLHTNTLNQAMPPAQSKWKISNPIKSVELFGDLRMRYEHREATTPPGSSIVLDRGRAALRIGLRGDAVDDFYYGLRLETSSNPRSPWINFGGSSPAPFGKSNTGVDLGQFYIGWRPQDWLDVTVGKMPNPLYTTPMVWDSDLNPEGAVERFKYSVGPAGFFANFAQFLYKDNNPSFISGSLIPQVNDLTSNGDRQETDADATFLLAWQAGVNAQLAQDTSAKIAPVLYNYIGHLNTNVSGMGLGDPFIGEGSYGGKGSSTPINGLTSQNNVGSPLSYNQIGINNLLVLEVPFEVNFKIKSLNARVFGDYAYNLEGSSRALAAYRAVAYRSSAVLATAPLTQYGAQTHDVQAYQVGFALGSLDSLGLVYGTVSRKHAWEVRTYWQHVEQYALDPNLLDSDFFEGRGNLEGVYVSAAYGFTDNVIGTIRYGYAQRINEKLGTGGSNLDIPDINPIEHYNLLQLDLTLRF